MEDDKESLATIESAISFMQSGKVPFEQFIMKVGNNMQFQLHQFKELLPYIYHNDQSVKLFALVGMRKLLSIENTPPIQEVIDANLISVFINFLHHEIPKFQFEAAWCLTNVASGSTDHVNNLIEKGVLKHFIALL